MTAHGPPHGTGSVAHGHGTRHGSVTAQPVSLTTPIVVRYSQDAPASAPKRLFLKMTRPGKGSRDGEGEVMTHGEVWNARGPEDLKPADEVRVASRSGLVLTIEGADPDREKDTDHD